MSVTRRPTFCQGCIYWEKVAPMGTGIFGICHEPTVLDKIRLDGGTSVYADGTIWTEEFFGCIHWRDRPLVVIDIMKELDDDDN